MIATATTRTTPVASTDSGSARTSPHTRAKASGRSKPRTLPLPKKRSVTRLSPSIMLIAPASFTMGPHLSRNPPYNPVTDFAPINLVADVPFVMVVPSTLPARTVKEFIALAKSSPNKLTFGSVGVGTPQHLGGELFKMHAGVDLIHVPFRGATAVLPDLVAGRIDMFIGAINSLLPLIKEGKLRAIAMAGSKRIASLPDVPTMAQAGLPGYESLAIYGIFVPAATPPASRSTSIASRRVIRVRELPVASNWQSP